MYIYIYVYIYIYICIYVYIDICICKCTCIQFDSPSNNLDCSLVLPPTHPPIRKGDASLRRPPGLLSASVTRYLYLYSDLLFAL